MSPTTDQPTPCARADRDDESGCDPERIVDPLGDDETRELHLYFETPATVRDAAESLDIPSSTAYRKINALQDAGLLRPLNQHARGTVPTHYVRSIDCVSVTSDDPLRIECVRNGTTLHCEL